ncbi:unnamed protein product [Adineta steineri]|uniref:Endonuclease n=1 Tax=Adineta steineri TaxID=433720 RepID=A0A815YH22_9BILA|nr:unnamed protein product [Adineta steineri]CAF1668477.1 unnamed protein product [Adineta steineri]
MSYVQGIGTLAAGVALGVLATSTYLNLWDKRIPANEGALLRFSPDLSTQTIRRLDSNFAVSYDRRTRVPLWTIEHLTRETTTPGNNVDRGNSVFREDNYIHPFFRSTNQDYYGSGFDRGHLIPSADHRHSQESMNNTFFLSNIAPQVGKGFNRDKWAHLERYARALVKHYTGGLWILTGPLYLPRLDPVDNKLYVKYQVIGSNQVAVPTHFFKVIIGQRNDGQLDIYSYLMPNEPIDKAIALDEFLVAPEIIEQNAGFLITTDKVHKNQIRAINQPWIDFTLDPPPYSKRQKSISAPSSTPSAA